MQARRSQFHSALWPRGHVCCEKIDGPFRLATIPLDKGGSAEGAGVVLTAQGCLEDADVARDSDSSSLGFPHLQDNPRTASPSPPLTRENFSQLPLEPMGTDFSRCHESADMASRVKLIVVLLNEELSVPLRLCGEFFGCCFQNHRPFKRCR